jgi:putative sterol carrier protein
VARYLSEGWFAEVAAATPTPDKSPDVVLQQIVTDSPDGEVRYQVVVADGRAVLTRDQTLEADATFTAEYATASAIARGELTTQAALLAGRIHVAGNMATLSSRQEDLSGLDPVPAAVRAATTF